MCRKGMLIRTANKLLRPRRMADFKRGTTVDHNNDEMIVIVGAGVCGLTMAHLLAKDGRKVVLLERNPTVGGLARSFIYGDYIFDIGPHRFHTANKHVGQYIREILGEEGFYFPRKSTVYFRGEYYPWPLRPKSLLKFPLSIGIRAALDLALNSFKKYEGDTFEAYVLRQYGPTLYRHFFMDYSEKFLKIHPKDTHADWARTGINRAIIDDNVKMNNLFQVVRSMLANVNKEELNFLYPKGGLQTWCNRAAEAFLKEGGELLLDVDRVELEHDGERITEVRAGERRWKPNHLIWTGSIIQLCELLGLPRPELEYLAIVMFYVEVRAHLPEEFQWCYFGEKDTIFNRISNNIHFSPELAPWGCSGLEVEVSCMKGDEVWNNPESIRERVIDDLLKVRLLSRRDEIRDIHIEKIPESYPIYHKDYRKRLKRTRDQLARWSNLTLAGRTGQFWYNNMDHSIGKALSVVRKMLGQDHHIEGANFGREDEEL